MKIIMNGACGHMGQTIIRTALKQGVTVLSGADTSGIAESEGIKIFTDINDCPKGADVVIDFSRPVALSAVVDYCVRNSIRLVVGTTGLKEPEFSLLKSASEHIPVFQSGNMSVGVNLQIELAKMAAAALGDAFDTEIVEKHHKLKVDAPSGTALMLADAISSQFPSGRKYVLGRQASDERRRPEEIGLHSLRGGTVVGEHTIEFFGEDEVVEIAHKAYSKQVFAAGALRAANYLMAKPAGLYNMHDIVTEQDVLSHLYKEDGQAVITVSPLPHEPGALSAIFGAVADENVFVDMISLSAPGGNYGDVSFSVPSDQLDKAISALRALSSSLIGMQIYSVNNVSKITVEGPGMAIRYGVAAEFFKIMANAGVNIELVTTSETKIAVCVRDQAVPKALEAIAEAFKL